MQKHATLTAITLFFLGLNFSAYAQIPMNGNEAHDDYSYKSYIPQTTSPNVASLGRYADIPVSMFTGVADISI